MLHFAPFFSTPFELYALNSILLFTLFLSNFNFSDVLRFFFREGVRIEPHITFCVFLSTPFELYARTPSYFLPHFCPNFNFSAVVTPCYISGRFCPAKPKIKTLQPTPGTPH